MQNCQKWPNASTQAHFSSSYPSIPLPLIFSSRNKPYTTMRLAWSLGTVFESIITRRGTLRYSGAESEEGIILGFYSRIRISWINIAESNSISSSSCEAGKRPGRFLLLPSFVLSRSSMDWMVYIHIREGNLPYQVYQFTCKSIQKHSHRHTQK